MTVMGGSWLPGERAIVNLTASRCSVVSHNTRGGVPA